MTRPTGSLYPRDTSCSGRVLTLLRRCRAAGVEVIFQVRATTPVEKIFDAFCKKRALSRESMRFMINGQNVDPALTVGDLELEDGDFIDCFESTACC